MSLRACVAHSHSLPLEVAWHSPGVSCLAPIHTAGLNRRDPRLQERVLGTHLPQRAPTPQLPHQPCPDALPEVSSPQSCSQSPSLIRAQMQTPKPQLQPGALCTQAVPTWAVGAHLLPEACWETAPQPCSLAAPPPQGWAATGQRHWGSHLHRCSRIHCSLNLGNSSKVFPMCPALRGADSLEGTDIYASM